MVVELQQDLTCVLQISEAQLNSVKLFTTDPMAHRQPGRASCPGMAMLALVTH